MIGKTILHYKITEKLGEGGMGIVYKARDTRLDREVAIKFLPRHIAGNAEERQRFDLEAKAAAALNHPNISTIHAIEEHDGELFIVMEFIDGQELQQIVGATGRSPLPTDTILNYASQIASGLHAAHAKGIVHRDIKSSNIMVTESRQVKIMDFGLAKVAGTDVRLTKEHTTIGTAAYMAPEQARGKDIDHRTDIWAFGVVLYEMLTGELPFKGDYEQAVVYSILNEEPQQISELREDVPETLQQIVTKALAKDAGQRYQSVDTILHDLQKISTPPKTANFAATKKANTTPTAQRSWLPIGFVAVALVAIATIVFALWPAKQTDKGNAGNFRSIAVLPFIDLSPQKDQEYFCDGMTDEILTKLAQLPEIKVIARTSVMRYKNTEKTIKEIGDELDVETVLEGSVRKAGDEIRVTAQLIKAGDESHLWASNYDGKLKNIFSLQEKIAKAIAEALHVQMTPHNVSALENSAHKNLKTYDLVMQGKFEQYNNFAPDRAMQLFDQALAIDPDYVPALIEKAGAYHMRWVFGGFADMDALRRKRELAERAVQLDPENPEALPMLAHAYITSFKEATDAVYEMCKKALSHNPNSRWALEAAAFFFINRLGMYDQGVEYFKLTVARDPFGYIYYNLAGTFLTYLGEYAQATEMFTALRERATNAQFNTGDQILLAVLTGDQAQADSLLRKAEKFNINMANANKAYLLAAQGHKEEAIALERNPIVYMLLGMREEALAELQKRAEHPTQSQYQFMTRFPLFEPLKQDIHFADLVEKEKKKLDASITKYHDLMVK